MDNTTVTQSVAARRLIRAFRNLDVSLDPIIDQLNALVDGLPHFSDDSISQAHLVDLKTTCVLYRCVQKTVKGLLYGWDRKGPLREPLEPDPKVEPTEQEAFDQLVDWAAGLGIPVEGLKGKSPGLRANPERPQPDLPSQEEKGPVSNATIGMAFVRDWVESHSNQRLKEDIATAQERAKADAEQKEAPRPTVPEHAQKGSDLSTPAPEPSVPVSVLRAVCSQFPNPKFADTLVTRIFQLCDRAERKPVTPIPPPEGFQLSNTPGPIDGTGSALTWERGRFSYRNVEAGIDPDEDCRWLVVDSVKG